jgi:galactonate dehydratase
MVRRIRRVSTYRWEERPHVVFVEVETSDGIVGLGEGWGIPSALEAVIHDFAIPLIVANGGDADRREAIWNQLFSVANIWNSAGAEMRAISAIDIALWDIAGQASGLPIYQLLGGRVRDSIRGYNTCVDGGRYNDGSRATTEPGELAAELLDSGIRGIKLWPFDPLAPSIDARIGRSHGWPSHLPEAELARGIQAVAAIRERVGDAIDIMIEGHHRWDVSSAIRIGRALEPYRPAWMEDMTLTDNARDLRRLVDETRVPILASERLMTRFAFRSLLDSGACHVVMIDIGIVGGLSEAVKVAAMTGSHNLPITTHDCNGPITCLANLHFSVAIQNAINTEIVRGFYDGGWYEDVLTIRLPIEGGEATAPESPGLGAALRRDFTARSDVVERRSTL